MMIKMMITVAIIAKRERDKVKEKKRNKAEITSESLSQIPKQENNNRYLTQT